MGTRTMDSMRTLINLVEDFSSRRVVSASLNRIQHNAKVLQSNIKFIDAEPSLQARLNDSIATVVAYLDQL